MMSKITQYGSIGNWFYSLTYRLSGVAEEGQVGTRASGRTPWRRINTLNSAI